MPPWVLGRCRGERGCAKLYIEMLSRKNILIGTALLLSWAAPLLAAPALYSSAAARWSAEQAVKLPPAITPAFIKEVELSYGKAAAAALAEKKEKVGALLDRFGGCALDRSDLETSRKYFTPEFQADVAYFVNGGCAEFRKSAGGAAVTPNPGLAGMEELAASGRLATPEGASAFFDGSTGRGSAVPAVSAGSAPARPAAQPCAGGAAPASKPLSSAVPALPGRLRAAVTPPERPAGLGEDGKVHQAMAYWADLRKEGWTAYKGGELTGAAKAKALAKAAAGAGFGGLLWLSNLSNVEIAAARLGWDVGAGAGAGVIATDAAKLVFHSAVFAMLLVPIPLTKVAAAARAGQPWAIAFVGAMAAGPANRFIFHFAD